jgi:hypothetical protein
MSGVALDLETAGGVAAQERLDLLVGGSSGRGAVRGQQAACGLQCDLTAVFHPEDPQPVVAVERPPLHGLGVDH